MHDSFDIVCDTRCRLGEGPLWSAQADAVYWVDILSAKLYRWSLAAGAVSSWTLPGMVGWVIERRDRAGFIAGLQSGFHELTLDPLECRAIADPEPQYPGNRMNDAKADHRGRIWAGTMDSENKKATGSLYCLDTDFNVSMHDSGYLVSNGPAIDPQRACFYHSDTGRGIVYRFELTASGDLRDKREFIRFPKEWGQPDGMTVDAEGGLWIAHWRGGRVTRFTPAGEPERDIRLPASQITSCTFGGADLDRMFVTSAAEGRDDEPQAGMLFEVDPGVTGLPANRFG